MVIAMLFFSAILNTILKVLAQFEFIMWSFNALLKLFKLSQDFIFSCKLFHTLAPILDNQYCLLVVRVYFCLKQFFCLVQYTFPERLLVKYDCILCGNLLLIALYIIMQVSNLTS